MNLNFFVYDQQLAYVNYIVIVIYMLAMLGVGVYSGLNKNKGSGTKEYFQASGKIPGWATGISIWATTLSAITYMATPAKSFSGTWAFAFGNITIFLFTPILIKWFLPFFKKLQVETAYEYLDKRYGTFMRLFTSVLFMLMHIGRVGIIIYLPTLALSKVIPGANTDTFMYVIAVALGVICVVYTYIGGIRGVIWTDVIQGIVLLAGVIIVIFFVLAESNFLANTGVDHSKIINVKDWQMDLVNSSIPLIFISQFINNAYQYVGSQDVVQRYSTSKTIKETKSGIWGNAWLAILTIFLFYGVGTLLYIFYYQHPERMTGGTFSPDNVLPYFVIQELPIGLSGIIIAAILAAAQSSISSSLNAVSSCVNSDIVEKFVPRTSAKKKMIIAKSVVAGTGLLGTLFAVMLISSQQADMLNYYLSIIGLFGAPIFAAYVLGIFTKRTSYIGISIATCLGFLISLAVWFLSQPAIIHHAAYVNSLYTAIVGFVVTIVLGYLLSLFIRDKNKNLDNLTWYSLADTDKIRVFDFKFIDLYTQHKQNKQAHKEK